MPPRTPKACRVRGCRNTTTDPSGYCDAHKGEGWRQYKPGQTRQQRGYGTKWEINDDVVKPIKEQNENKIDGAVALIMAVGRVMLKEPGDFLSSLDPDDDLLIL